MNSTNSSSASGRCGMCGACGAMPPWAPEMLKNATPEARRALERHMQEAQRRFIEMRDATKKTTESPENESSYNSSQREAPLLHSENDLSAPIRTAEHSNGRGEEKTTRQGETTKQLQNIDSSVEPQPESNAEIRLASLGDPTLSDSVVHLGDDANIEISLESPTNTPLPPTDQEPLQTERSPLPPDEYHVLQAPRRKLPQFASPALQESPVPTETKLLEALPDISLEPNQLSEPLRTISLRDADSDADSFHTADGEELLRRSSDGLSLKDDEDLANNVAPIVSEAEWQAFQSEEGVSEPEASTPAVSESFGSAAKEQVVLEGHTQDATQSEPALSHSEIVQSQPTESLEDSVIALRTTAHGPSSPQAQRDALMDDYALPADFVRPNEIELDPRPCQDCERWRERVQELELKVEALTSALNAREMESASMRARAADKRYHGKNEAQLMQECESLRITTEYLVCIHFSSLQYCS